jgi:hypothetical protein
VIATNIASSGKKYQDAFNDNMLHIVRVAEVQCFNHMLKTFISSIDTIEQKQSTSSDKSAHADIPTLRKLCSLWGLHVLQKYMDFATMEGYLSATQARTIQSQYYQVMNDDSAFPLAIISDYKIGLPFHSPVFRLAWNYAKM